MREFLVTLLLFACLMSSQAISRADTTIHQLSVEEKVAMLFVLPQAELNKDSVHLGNTRFDSYWAYDTRFTRLDSLSVPRPSAETYRSISDKAFVKEYKRNLFQHYTNLGYDGIITPHDEENIARLYLGDSSVYKNSYIQVIDFPCDLLDELLANSKAKDSLEIKDKSLQSVTDLKAMQIWEPAKPLTISFQDILKRDLLFWDDKWTQCRTQLTEAVLNGFVPEKDLDVRIEKLLNYQIMRADTLDALTNVAELKELRYQAYEKSIAIYQQEDLLPIQRVDTLKYFIQNNTESKSAAFNEHVKFYHPTKVANIDQANLQFVVCDQEDRLLQVFDELKTDTLHDGRANVLVYAGSISKETLSSACNYFDAFVLMPQQMQYTWSLLAQASYAGLPVSGKSKHDRFLCDNNYKRLGTLQSRLGFNKSFASSMLADSLFKIDSIVYDAIKKKATPGAQLLVVKGGNVVVQKSYGHHTYSKKQRVANSDLYDVASITKLAVTFPLVMQLYEEEVLDLEATLNQYIPHIDTTDKADITIRELLLHQSGLPSYIPFHYKALDRNSLNKRSLYSRHYSWLHNIRVDTRLYQNKYARYRKDVFSKTESDRYNRQLTNTMFMHEHYVDSMYHFIYNANLREGKNYRYSDLGYYLLQRIIESEEQQRLDSIFYHRISQPLGANKMLYKPLENYATREIVPTEKDLGFRRVLLDGYVHDQGAAMLGGVAAHAGLFANAGDLAKLGQMLLNEGSYGGVQYIKPRTIGKFTKTYNHGNRRGLGVDKPRLEPDENSHVSHKASPASFGHTGFTGTILWIDPEHDLMYIFLSNRIHPRSFNKKLIEMNVRTKIQDVVYNTLVD